MVGGGHELVMLWARTWTPEYSVFAYTREVDSRGRDERVVRLRQAGCEMCKQREWTPLFAQGKLYAEVSVEPRQARVAWMRSMTNPTLITTTAMRALKCQCSCAHGRPDSHVPPLMCFSQNQPSATIAHSQVVLVDLSSGLCTPIINSSAPETGMHFQSAQEMQQAVGSALHAGPPSVKLSLGNGSQVRQLGSLG